MIQVRILVHHQQISSATDVCHASYQFVHRIILESLTHRRAIIVGPGQLHGCNRGPNNDLQQSVPQQLAHSTSYHTHEFRAHASSLLLRCRSPSSPGVCFIPLPFLRPAVLASSSPLPCYLSLRPGRYISTVVMSCAPLPISLFSCARVIHLASSSRSSTPESASYVSLVTTSFHFGPPRMVPL